MLAPSNAPGPTVAAVAAIVLLGGTSTGWAYVSSVTPSGTPIRWSWTRCVFLQVNVKGSDDIRDGSDVAAVKRATENWRKATRQCSYLQLVPIESTGAGSAVDKDGENLVFWEEKRWDYSPAAAGLTVTFFKIRPGEAQDGQLIDADIVLNGQHFHFSTTGEPDRTDVENIVTHELGHLMGLEHPCYEDDDEPRLKDHDGEPIPACKGADPDLKQIEETTMFAFADPGETKKRTPESDDVRGVCDLYPLGEDPGVCSTSGAPGLVGGGCSVGVARSTWSPSLSMVSVALLLLLLGTLRRRW
jgi:hypothetical protein